MDIQIQSPYRGTELKNGVLPYGSFVLSINVTEAPPPFQVAMREIAPPAITVGGVTVGGGSVARLDRPTRILRAGPVAIYSVPNLRSFEMRYPDIRFRVDLETDDRPIEAFKGSMLEISISNAQGFGITTGIAIANANPNNHFHWRAEPKFVDGWYFKCVHVDAASGVATPFFFLYGVNDPSGGDDAAESFVMYGRAGEAKLGADLRPVAGPLLSTPDTRPRLIFKPPNFAFEAEYGLDARIPDAPQPPFTASDGRCTGTAMQDGEPVSWDLSLTKAFTGCKTDWNPLAAMDPILELAGNRFIENPKHMPLMRHLKSVPGISAYYMSHNMSCIASGTVDWKGKKYVFDRQPAYQDSNWGAGGFPHPYVWMQANHFRTGAGAPLPSTALVALITPKMPLFEMELPFSKVAGICLRHDGQIYRFLAIPLEIAELLARLISPLLPVRTIVEHFVPELADIACTVEFVQDGARKVVDMSSASSVDETIDPFKTRRAKAFPVKWTMSAKNGNGDQLSIEVTCDQATVMELAAPLDGKMTDAVTKETLLARFVVTLTPSGGTATPPLVSDFGTAEFGD